MSLRQTISILLILSLVAAANCLANDQSSEPDQLAHSVMDVFLNHCAKCHDPQHGKIHGGFDHVLDLKRMVSEAIFITPNHPEQSILFDVIVTGDMPRKSPRLPERQIDMIRRWIQSGAPAPKNLKTAQDHSSPKIAAESETRYRNRFVVWLGKFHPSIVHFPIGLITGAAIAELLKMVIGSSWLGGAARFCMGTGAIIGVLATLLGWANAGLWSGEDLLTTLHRWLGTVTAGLSITAFILSERFHRRPSPQRRKAYRMGLFISASLVLITGFLGGAIVYGLYHLAW